jgi:hypothetical protein
MTTINDVWSAYEKATGQWTGCNWPARYGGLGLDLDNVSALKARRNAKRWRAIAANELADDAMSAGEEASLVDVAAHQRRGGAVSRRVQYPGLSPQAARQPESPHMCEDPRQGVEGCFPVACANRS